MGYKLKPKKLQIGKNYFLVDYENDIIVEGMFFNHDLYNGNESYDFMHSITIDADGVKVDDKKIYLILKDGVLKENVGDQFVSAWVENPIFSTREEAETKKKKYILASLKAVRKLILEELKENTNQIKKIIKE